MDGWNVVAKKKKECGDLSFKNQQPQTRHINDITSSLHGAASKVTMFLLNTAHDDTAHNKGMCTYNVCPREGGMSVSQTFLVM